MKAAILLTLALLTPICFAGGKPPPVQDVPVRVDNTNLNANLNANLNHNQLEQDQRQRQEQEQAQAQLQGQQQHSENTNNLHGGDSVSTVDSTVINETVIGDTVTTATSGDQITEVVVNPNIANTSSIAEGAIDNRQSYVNHFEHRERIQHTAPVATHNSIGTVTKASSSFVVTGSYDGQEGSSVNVGFHMPIGGGNTITKQALKTEAAYLKIRNNNAEQAQTLNDARFCIDLQQSGVPVTEANDFIWKRCKLYVIQMPIKYLNVEGHHHKPNADGSLTYDGVTYQPPIK